MEKLKNRTQWFHTVPDWTIGICLHSHITIGFVQEKFAIKRKLTIEFSQLQSVSEEQILQLSAATNAHNSQTK